MAVCLNTPPVIAGNSTEQIQQLRNYVFQTVEDLNVKLQDMTAEGILQQIDSALSNTSENYDDTDDTSILAIHNNVRSLIIKTADFAVSNSEEFKKILKSEYSASSDYGELIEKLENEITVNSEGINQLFRYTSGIRSEFGDL